MSGRILVVEDDRDVRLLLRLLLEDQGFTVVEAATGPQALEQFRSSQPSLVLLDVRLPGMSGFEVGRELRAKTDVPIIMVTAQDDSHDIVAGLEAGADDYVTKPFNDKELLARVRAQLRRATRSVRSAASVTIQHLEIRATEGRVLRNGEDVSLTRTEFRLLTYFAENSRLVLSRQTLLEQVWGYDHSGDDRLVDAHVRRLRTKIEIDPAAPTIVQTVRGLGYRLTP